MSRRCRPSLADLGTRSVVGVAGRGWPVQNAAALPRAGAGVQRARHQAQRLKAHGLHSTFRKDGDGGLLRLGPLTHAAVWLALEAFLGPPVPLPEVDPERFIP